MLTEDIENEIPVNNLIFSQGSNELRVKVVKKIANGYKETTIEKLKALSCPEKQICVTKPFQRWQAIANTICCSVEDIKQAVSLQDCWKVYDAKFRRVLLYGKIVVTNHFSRDGRTIYKFAVDDGSGEIFGTMNIKKETKRNCKILCFEIIIFKITKFNFQCRLKLVDLQPRETSLGENKKSA